MKVSDVKKQLKEIISKLDEFDDNVECLLDIDDNCGGSYFEEFKNFIVYKGISDKVIISNCVSDSLLK